MRTTLFLTTVLGTALIAACTTEVKSTDFRTADSGVTPSGDGGTKTGSPIKAPSTTKDAGTSDPKPPPSTAPTTCKTAVECLGECPDGDDACSEACYASLPAAEMTELEELATCIADSGCETDECLADVCATPINVCLGN
jgi:hypothetical protein